MTKVQAKKVFEENNPINAVTRCPSGRGPIRKLLDSYAKAAVNLYGVIPIADLVEIFNNQNEEKTNAAEVFALLLPFVLRSKWYCFYKGHIAHYWAIEDFEEADVWLYEQGDKKRYIPNKEELLKFENQYYEDATQLKFWERLYKFIKKEWPTEPKTYRFYNELKELSNFGSPINDASELMLKLGFSFQNDKQMETFFNLLIEAHNNTKCWANKGYSPTEMRNILDSTQIKKGEPEFVLQKKIKVGPNALCPCGSGKKFKKCCNLIEEAQTAQLSRSDLVLFYETWYGLMGFINEHKKLVPVKIKPVYPNLVSDELIFKVREVLWENPILIDSYIVIENLSKEKVEILKGWRDHHKKGLFFLAEYTPDHALLIGNYQNKDDIIYAVKGLSRPLSDVIRRELPVTIETVLLPFKDVIIYDTFISSMPLSYTDRAKSFYQEMYKNALGNGIVTQF